MVGRDWGEDMKPSTRRCRDVLRSREWATVADFLTHGVGTRYSARILELRALGYVIDARPVKDRSGYVYRLVAEPKPQREPEPAPPPEGCLFDAETFARAA